MTPATPPDATPPDATPPDPTPTDPAPAAPSPPRPTHSPRSALAVFTAAGFLLTTAGGFYIWSVVAGLDRPEPMIDPTRITALEIQVRALQQRLTTLEQRPTTPSIDMRPLEARLAALEQRQIAPAALPPPAPIFDIAPIEARLAAAERVARLQSATMALEAGLPLGAIPGAPPALARFATVAPPTLATLRASYPAAARAAQAASRPAEPAADWSERMRQSLAGLVTIRQGNVVLLGAPAAVILAEAQARLDTGDLGASLTVLDALDPGAATSLAPWRAETAALLAARAGLAAMARP